MPLGTDGTLISCLSIICMHMSCLFVCLMVFNATFNNIFQLYRGDQFYWSPKQKHDVWCRKSTRSYIVVWDMHKNVYTLFTIDYGMILHYSSVSVSSSSEIF
jgi:hypothetical protein